MATVFLGLGSNIERERYICAGLDALERLFGELGLSPVYDSAAIGFEGQAFLNMVVRAQTSMSVSRLARDLRAIEYEHGRPYNAPRFSARQLDIDILTYDDLVGSIDGVQLPREEVLQNAFVLQPLADLNPDGTHPLCGIPYAQLWSAFPKAGQKLARIDFEWRGRQISKAQPA